MSYSPENFESLRIAVEQASKIVISSNVSNQERAQSESIFIEFRKSKSPYDFCRYLLETSKEPYVIFQAISTLREAALREWSLLPSDLVPNLQTSLLSYVFNTSLQIDKYVQRQILQTIAVFYKRTKLDMFSRNCQNLDNKSVNIVQESIELFKSADIKLKHLICSLMLALIIEFSNTNKSTKLGLSNDSHFTAKRSFEQNEFKSILLFVFQTTQNLIESLIQNNITNIRLIDVDSKEMLMQLFSLIDQSLNWEFTSSKHVLKNLIGNFNTNQTSSTQTISSLEPTPEFKDFFLNENLTRLLFKCYELVRDDPDMSHASIQSIIQLSTLNGAIFKDDHDGKLKIEFINIFIDSFLSIFTKVQIKDYETFNLACLTENLILMLNSKNYNQINPQLIEAFFNLVCSFLINCFKAEKICEDSLESKKYLESYEKILISWSHLKDSCFQTEDEKLSAHFNLFFRNYSQPIVDAFIQSRLTFNLNIDQEDIRLNHDDDFESISDGDDSNEDDLHRYKEILYSISEFSKLSLDFCLPLLSKLLYDKYIQLTEILKQIIQYKMSKLDQQKDQFDLLNKHLNNLNEDIHWLLLVTGFTIFEISSDTEQSKIPDEIMKYSIKCSSLVDKNLLNRIFQGLNDFKQLNSESKLTISLSLIDTKITDLDPCDPITRFVFNTLQLCELETHMSSLNMLEYMSPQVASSLVWFLKELSHSYLFMNEQNYNELSPILQAVFGQDTNYGISILNYLLRKIISNFYIWSSENMTTKQTAKLLLEIVKRKEMSKILLQNEQFWSISKVASPNEMPWLLLSTNVKKLVIKSLVISCGNHNDLMQAHFVSNVLKPISDRFDTLNTVKREFIHTENCIKEVMSLIETLNGIIEGASKNIVQDFIPFILPRLQQGVRLLDVYHNYGEIVELILCMFNGVIEKFICNLSNLPDLRNQIFECFLGMIQIFSKHNSKKRSIEANNEEDYFNDLLLFLTLLNTLHNIDYENEDDRFLTNQNLNTSQNAHNQIKIIDIILMGLEFLIPLMNQEILKFQSLWLEYFKLVSHIAFNNSDKLFSRSHDLFVSLINSIEYGLNSSLGIEVVRYSLECISPLCNHVFKNNLQQTNFGLCLRNLFKTFFDMLFRNSIEIELSDISCNVLYSFICCFQDAYTVLVNQLVEQFNDENIRLKICEGFNNLTPSNFNFNLEKRNRIKFSSKFNDFCIKTYGLLFIR